MLPTLKKKLLAALCVAVGAVGMASLPFVVAETEVAAETVINGDGGGSADSGSDDGSNKWDTDNLEFTQNSRNGLQLIWSF